jgi:hypothetical protein
MLKSRKVAPFSLNNSMQQMPVAPAQIDLHTFRQAFLIAVSKLGYLVLASEMLMG